jgi:hypothetical protein
MSTPSRLVALVGLLALLPASAAAGLLRVPEDHPTIASGLQAAVAGDTVDVACGTYYESVLRVKGGVTLRSRTGQPDCTTIDARKQGAVVKFEFSAIPGRIEGFTLVNGSSANAGGIGVIFALAEIERCIIYDCEQLAGGAGGVYVYEGSLDLKWTAIVGNRGAGVNGFAQYPTYSLSMVHCTVAGNTGAAVGLGTFSTRTLDRCIFANNADSGPTSVATSSCFWPAAAGGTNFTADPAFCDPASGDYRLTSGSPCLPGENPVGLVGALSVGCGPVSYVPVTVDTSPSGYPIVVDGVSRTSPANFSWLEYSRHVISAPTTPGSGGTRYRFDAWSDGGTESHGAWVPTGGGTFLATMATQHHLGMIADGPGTLVPGSGWHDEGATVTVSGAPAPGRLFGGWTGTGAGSYSGPNNPATVTLNQPVTEVAHFDPISFDFTISASSTDPFVHSSPPTMGSRPLWLWMTCSNAGISAFEAAVDGTLFPSQFTPENGVLNAGSATHLLLAIPGCPTGEDVTFRMGYWMVGDTGGTICLTKSPVSDRITGVDCNATPGVVLLPRVVGFSSEDSDLPCAMGTDRCGSPDVPATYITVGAPPLPGGASRLTVTGANPFAERTRLSFGLDRDSAVRLTVYDIVGRRIQTLADRRFAPGTHAVEWDGTGRDGAALPSGVYLVRLLRDGAAETAKVTLVRSR